MLSPVEAGSGRLTHTATQRVGVQRGTRGGGCLGGVLIIREQCLTNTVLKTTRQKMALLVQRTFFSSEWRKSSNELSRLE